MCVLYFWDHSVFSGLLYNETVAHLCTVGSVEIMNNPRLCNMSFSKWTFSEHPLRIAAKKAAGHYATVTSSFTKKNTLYPVCAPVTQQFHWILEVEFYVFIWQMVKATTLPLFIEIRSRCMLWHVESHFGNEPAGTIEALLSTVCFVCRWLFSPSLALRMHTVLSLKG